MIEKSLLLDMLEEGDGVMADKGFTIADMLEKKGCTLNIPPFRSVFFSRCAKNSKLLS